MPVIKDNFSRRHRNQPIKFDIRSLAISEIDQVIPLLQANVKDRITKEPITDDVWAIKRFINGEPDECNRVRHYLAAYDSSGKILGIMAYSTLDPAMIRHFDTIDQGKAIEILNAFVHPFAQKGGVGKALFNYIADISRQLGRKYLVCSSGPRYYAGWGFHDKMFDTRKGFLQDGQGDYGIMTWIKRL